MAAQHSIAPHNHVQPLRQHRYCACDHDNNGTPDPLPGVGVCGGRHCSAPFGSGSIHSLVRLTLLRARILHLVEELHDRAVLQTQRVRFATWGTRDTRAMCDCPHAVQLSHHPIQGGLACPWNHPHVASLMRDNSCVFVGCVSAVPEKQAFGRDSSSVCSTRSHDCW